MQFKKGRRKTGGRQSGTPNKVTVVFREAVETVYSGLGGHDAFLKWARKNQTEYYKIAARLIPSELRIDDDRLVNVFIAPVPRVDGPAVLDNPPAQALIEGSGSNNGM